MWLWRQGSLRTSGEASKVTAHCGPCSLLKVQLVVTCTVSLKNVLRADKCLSERSGLNRGRNSPSWEECKLRSSGRPQGFFANGYLWFPGCQEGRGRPGAAMPCKSPAASAWSPAPSPYLAVWRHLPGHGRGCAGENWIKKLLPTLLLPINAQAQAGRLLPVQSQGWGVRECRWWDFRHRPEAAQHLVTRVHRIAS